MDQSDKARALEEQAARARELWELSYGRTPPDGPDPLTACQLTQDELDLLYSQVPGHRWSGWHRLTGDEDYYGACSCGWRSTETGDMSLMLRQVKDHLDTVRQSRGWRMSARAPARDQSGPDVGRGEILDLRERARELRASVDGQRLRLSRSLTYSTDLLSASAEQADYLVAELERGKRARTRASAPSAEIVRDKVERARELRKAIVAAAAALAVITEEIASIHQGLETGHPTAPDTGK